MEIYELVERLRSASQLRSRGKAQFFKVYLQVRSKKLSLLALSIIRIGWLLRRSKDRSMSRLILNAGFRYKYF